MVLFHLRMVRPTRSTLLDGCLRVRNRDLVRRARLPCIGTPAVIR
jgi:hypothetical protein